MKKIFCAPARGRRRFSKRGSNVQRMRTLLQVLSKPTASFVQTYSVLYDMVFEQRRKSTEFDHLYPGDDVMALLERTLPSVGQENDKDKNVELLKRLESVAARVTRSYTSKPSSYWKARFEAALTYSSK